MKLNDPLLFKLIIVRWKIHEGEWEQHGWCHSYEQVETWIFPTDEEMSNNPVSVEWLECFFDYLREELMYIKVKSWVVYSKSMWIKWYFNVL